LPGLMRGEVESHPGRPLEDHLLKTANLAEDIARRCLGMVPEELRYIGLLHDVAKAHPRFQAHLKGKGRFGHSEPSGCLALAITRDIIIAEAIRCHHTRMRDDFINEFWCNSDYKDIGKVLAEIPMWPGCEVLAREIGIQGDSWIESWPSSQGWDGLLEYIEDTVSLDEDAWLNFRVLYSLLITADRLDAVSGGVEDMVLPKFALPEGVFEEYIAGMNPTPLAAWRQGIRRKVLETAPGLLSGPGVYTLTLPTGAGKTLVALELAANVAQRDSKYSIIYVLPFITIVEQNSNVAKSIFQTVQQDHHLAYQGEGEESGSLQRFVAMFRYWREPVVVTTFAKLWEVLYSPRANDSMCFHRMANAVIVLDEPQSIPVRYWKGFGETIDFVARKLDSVFILITATQPRMVKGKELAPGKIVLPRSRYTVRYFKESLNIDEMLSALVGQGLACRNTMVVANTRKAALEILFSIRKRSLVREPLFFLSSWVTPADRKRVFKELRAIEEQVSVGQGGFRYLVSTQVVEAGADLDFDMVVRDIAPLDSIVQVAGRCNRHMSDQEGLVLVFELADGQGKGYAKAVYDPILINFTREQFLALDRDGEIQLSEMQVADLINSYYEKLADLNDDGPWFEIRRGKWGSEFSLFDEPSWESTVLIDYRGDIKTIISDIAKKASGIEDRDKRRKMWQEIQDYAINVPESELKQWDDKCGGFIYDDRDRKIEMVSDGLWIVNPSGIGHIYRSDCGFVPVNIYRKFFEDGF